RPALWELPSGRLLRTFRGAGTYVPNSLDLSRDGRRLAAAYKDGLVRVWEVRSGKELRSPVCHTDVMRAAAFSPDGQALAVTRGCTVSIETLYPEQQRTCRELSGHASSDLEAVAFSPDGRSVASRSGDGAILIHDLGAEKVTQLRAEVADR